jgi:hypothetical protein
MENKSNFDLMTFSFVYMLNLRSEVSEAILHEREAKQVHSETSMFLPFFQPKEKTGFPGTTRPLTAPRPGKLVQFSL